MLGWRQNIPAPARGKEDGQAASCGRVCISVGVFFIKMLWEEVTSPASVFAAPELEARALCQGEWEGVLAGRAAQGVWAPAVAVAAAHGGTEALAGHFWTVWVWFGPPRWQSSMSLLMAKALSVSATCISERISPRTPPSPLSPVGGYHQELSSASELL